MKWAQISEVFKPALYKSPYPLFVWNENTDRENIWTGASLYWALVDLDKIQATSKSAPTIQLPNFPSHKLEVNYENFSHLFWESAQISLNQEEYYFSIAPIIRIQQPCSLEWILKLPKIVRRGMTQEVHFQDQLIRQVNS